MTTIDQSGLKGKTRDRPISRELELVLLKAGSAAGVDEIYMTSGGQSGTAGKSTGSTRHNGGRAAEESEPLVVTRPFRSGVDPFVELAQALAWSLPPDQRRSRLTEINNRLSGPDTGGGG